MPIKRSTGFTKSVPVPRKLAKFLDENSAYRFKEELGTQPRVWYLPGVGEAFGISPQDMNELKSLVWPESGI